MYLQGFCGLHLYLLQCTNSEGYFGKKYHAYSPFPHNSIPHLSIPTHSHSNDSEPQDLLGWIFLPLLKVHLHVQDEQLMEMRYHILQLDKLV